MPPPRAIQRLEGSPLLAQRLGDTTSAARRRLPPRGDDFRRKATTSAARRRLPPQGDDFRRKATARCHSQRCYSQSCHSQSCYSQRCYSQSCYSKSCYSQSCYSKSCCSQSCYSKSCYSKSCYSPRPSLAAGQRAALNTPPAAGSPLGAATQGRSVRLPSLLGEEPRSTPLRQQAAPLGAATQGRSVRLPSLLGEEPRSTPHQQQAAPLGAATQGRSVRPPSLLGEEPRSTPHQQQAAPSGPPHHTQRPPHRGVLTPAAACAMEHSQSAVAPLGHHRMHHRRASYSPLRRRRTRPAAVHTKGPTGGCRTVTPQQGKGSRSAKRSGSRCITEDAPWATSVSTSITIPPLPEGDRVNGHMPDHTIALKVPSV